MFGVSLLQPLEGLILFTEARIKLGDTELVLLRLRIRFELLNQFLVKALDARPGERFP